jgi:hypothetical protein
MDELYYAHTDGLRGPPPICREPKILFLKIIYFITFFVSVA